MSSLMGAQAQQHVSRIIATLHAVLDFSADRVAEELEQVPPTATEAVLAAVARHVVQYQQMLDSMREMDGAVEWNSLVEREQDAADLCYVQMTQSEFEAEKQRAKRDRRFRDWHGWRAWVERVDGKRRIAARRSLPPLRQVSHLDFLHAERREILGYGHAMFNTVEGRDRALLEVEAEIRRLGGRVERTDEQREAITSIDARLRQSRALKSCRRFIAAEMIRKFVVRNNTKSECEHCFDAFKPTGSVYCSRTCEKFAMRGKYD